MPVAGPLVGVPLNLQKQARHQIDRAAHFGKFEKVQRHAVIVFDAVQADPRHGILTGYIVRVVRLMLMPENHDAQNRHGPVFPDYNGIGLQSSMLLIADGTRTAV